jgi:epoxyqueuosine reductase
VGRNCFAYSEHGSWINLATWRVDAEIPPDRPTLDCPCPAGCQACLEACPTGALVEPFVMRQDRCIAHLTYGPEWPVPPELWTRMGAWVYGCDVCQEVCPLNRGTWRNAQRADWLDPVAAILTPEALADMDEATYRSVVHPRFWYIPEDGLARWRANAQRAVAAARGNAGAPQLCSNDAWTARACLPACRQVLAGRPSND